MILALLMMTQVPFIGLEEDRKVFEPYRQCVLKEARKQYASRDSLKIVFDQAQNRCLKEQATAAAEIALNAAARAIDASLSGEGEPGQPEYRFQLFENELLFEVANDFVPKVK
jgi:hypothetical protein